MKLLRTLTNKDFDLEEDFERSGLYERSAARAIIQNEKNEICIIPVSRGGYHKIPGGGIEEGENAMEAVLRETREEAGTKIEIIDEIGYILEYREDLKQYSYCFLAKTVGKIIPTNHTDEEIADGFQAPVWLPIDIAIEEFMKDECTFRKARFMSLRDRTFLEEARRLLK